MAETIISVIAEELLGKLSSLASNEISFAWGVQKDAQELVDTLTTIKAVLLDVEDKHIHNEKLKVWLGKLKEICYDAEYVLDEIEVKGLRKQVVNSQSSTRKVRHFFSSSNPIAFLFTLGHRIKEIKKRLAKIAVDKDNFNLSEKVDSNHVIGWERERETHSFVRASDVIDIDHLRVLQTLLIFECPRLISLPCGVRNLSSLEDLGFKSCRRLNLDLSIGSDKRDNHDELNGTWPHLRFLRIDELPQLVEFPKWLIQFSINNLKRLEIRNCSNLKALPESLEKLQFLGIKKCPELSSLPKDMDHLIALRELLIEDSSQLSKRCEPDIGEDWSRIAHIPNIKLDGKIIKLTEN
ncbi:hypothetical protein Pint_11513 [Pistacia integerrima]|uniref:Uncharacterized protein n=1 Tax=Pistacia integerrima TaxID=434235 RepID=A0ACC0XET7_9ROSI|nr:hypothetical protein Pint_11513 [Pistacia integerrima]